MKDKTETRQAEPRLACDLLERFMRDALVAAGVPAADAALVADVLIESDKRGSESHGIGRL